MAHSKYPIEIQDLKTIIFDGYTFVRQQIVMAVDL